MDFFFLPEVAPFSAALLAVGAIGVIETLGMLLVGVAGLTHVLDSIFEVPDMPDSAIPEWLLVKGMPLMVTIVAAVSGFALTGLAVQGVVAGSGSAPMSLLPAVCVGLVGALASIRGLSAVFSRFKLSMDTTAVSISSLIGRKAVLLSPVARVGYAGQASVKDEHGHTHYVMVVPESDAFELTGAQEFELVEPVGTTFRARQLK